MRVGGFRYKKTKGTSHRQQDPPIMCKQRTVSSLGTPAVKTLGPWDIL
jgi:hypothetical protein